jgi:Flp pilus assembly pilin Flp
MQRFYDFWRDEDGQDLIEYSLLITFFAIACMALMSAPRPALQAIWNKGSNVLVSASAIPAGN